MKQLFSTGLSAGSTSMAILIARILVGIFMLKHGLPKFEKLIDGNFSFSDPLGIGAELSLILAVLAEVVGSVFIIVGLGTRIAALALGFTMFVAAFIVHVNDPFGKKELALLYLAFCIVLAITGSGNYSLDKLMLKK